MTELVLLTRPGQTHVLKDLPRGKYIVCGEAITAGGEGYQQGCLETRVARVKSDSKYRLA